MILTALLALDLADVREVMVVGDTAATCSPGAGRDPAPTWAC